MLGGVLIKKKLAMPSSDFQRYHYFFDLELIMYIVNVAFTFVQIHIYDSHFNISSCQPLGKLAQGYTIGTAHESFS